MGDGAQLDRMDQNKTDAGRVFEIIGNTLFEGQAKYKVRTDYDILKSILDARPDCN